MRQFTVLLLAGLQAATAAAAPLLMKIDPQAAAEIGEVRVVLVMRPLNAERALELQDDDYTEDFDALIGAKLDAERVQEDADSDRTGTGTVVFLFASMGLGILGSIAESAHESSDIEEMAKPVLVRMEARRRELELDRKLAQAVSEALRARGVLKPGAEPEVYVAPKLAVHRKGAIEGFVEDELKPDPRSILLVGVEHGAPNSLAAVYGMAHLWLVPGSTVELPVVSAAPSRKAPRDGSAPTRADFATHHADGTPRREALPRAQRTDRTTKALAAGRAYPLGRQALLATPVPILDLQRPPPELAAARRAAVEAEYGPRIANHKDRDVRRGLRMERVIELEKASTWSPRSRTEYLRDAWLAAPGDVYEKLMLPAQDDLARRIAQSITLDQ